MSDEFVDLFRQEADAQLTRLGENVLRLESGGDPELIQSLFRDAHSLKGGAAMVGLADIARVAHALEDILEQLRAGKRNPEPALVDAVLAGVDAVRELLGGADASAADAAEQALRMYASGAAAEPQSASLAPTARVIGETEEGVPVKRTESGALVALQESETIAVPIDRLDELVRLVGESSAAHLRVGNLVTERLGEDATRAPAFRELTRVLGALQEHTMRARMVSVGTIAAPLRRAVRDAARATEKQARWEITGEQTELDRHVLERLRDPLMHLVRNSVDHGLEPPEVRVQAGKPAEGTVSLSASQVGSEVELVVADDGGGIDLGRLRAKAGRGDMSDAEAIEMLFQPGVSTADEVTDLSGRGVGLDVVRDSLDSVSGHIDVRTEPGRGTSFVIRVPMTLAALHSLLVTAGGSRYALPLQSVVTVLDGRGNGSIRVGDDDVPVSSLAAALGFDANGSSGPAVVLEGQAGRHAFRVDALVGQRAVVVKELPRVVPRLPLVAGASIEPDGSVMLVLDAHGLVQKAGGVRASAPSAFRGLRRALVVDDTQMMREMMGAMLETAGYEVTLAADAQEALLRIAEQRPDVILTDVEMPDMDGIELTRTLRSMPALADVPIAIVTTLTDPAARDRGLAAGAAAWLVKSQIDERALVDAVGRLLAVSA